MIEQMMAGRPLKFVSKFRCYSLMGGKKRSAIRFAGAKSSFEAQEINDDEEVE